MNTNEYYAYLELLEANTKKERTILFSKAIQDPNTAVLCYAYSNASDEELELALDKILTNISVTYSFLLKHYKKICKEHKDKIIFLLSQDIEFAKKIMYLGSEFELEYSQIKYIYIKYHNVWNLVDSIEALYDYCLLFKHCILEDELECLLDIVVESLNFKIAKLIKINFKLSDNLKNKIDNLFVLDKLLEE